MRASFKRFGVPLRGSGFFEESFKGSFEGYLEDVCGGSFKGLRIPLRGPLRVL